MSIDYTFYDQLELDQKYQETFDALKVALEQNPSDAGLLFRFGRAYWELAAEKPGDKKYQEEYFRKALEYTTKSIVADPELGAAHKWQAICISSLGDFVSTKEKILNAYKIKEHIDKAIALCPNDSTAHHVLGCWCKGIANVTWMERKIASSLFASPPEANLDDALVHLLQSYKLDPEYRNNLLVLADVYYLQKKWADAKQYYQKVIALPVISESDKDIFNKATAALKKL
eukprot:TRINITY_DN7944_c0_g1_i1.p1 TRINITY_DN7944_c0_g1~~TRINITY_DN7944_c0_g1_i1.p1  ORF type:complete len:230 (-),score=114.99 TRINITY_DN7944_c0_g1_i1:93-782(-)